MRREAWLFANSHPLHPAGLCCSYVPPLLAARDQLIRIGRVMRECWHALASLLAGPSLHLPDVQCIVDQRHLHERGRDFGVRHAASNTLHWC